MKTYVVHLVARPYGSRTFCGRRTSEVECLPEGDTLSPYERLCADCVKASTRRDMSEWPEDLRIREWPQ